MISLKMFSQKKCSEKVQLAIENDNLELVQKMIEKGENINCIAERKQTLLMKAIQSGKEKISLYLIEQNANINKVDDDNINAFFKTSYYGLTNVAKALIDKGIDINQRGYGEMTILMMASNRNQYDLVRFLIENKANINLQCDNGYTALTYTTSAKILSYLLSKKADFTLKNFEGKNALEQFKWTLEDVKGYGTKEDIINLEEIIEILKSKKY
tara:strand:+ start:48 stop:686 length:639 start_codon:yes stop_codon:yes gene_type:complete